jgi:hypothetical protein
MSNTFETFEQHELKIDKEREFFEGVADSIEYLRKKK